MDLIHQLNIISWGIVAIMALFSAFSKKCRSIFECSVVAAISLVAFGKVYIYVRQEVEVDSTAIALGILLAIYFMLKADVSWSRRALNGDTE